MGADASPRTDPAAAVLILSPHLDDAVWSCFSLLARGPGVVVATFFAGIPKGPPGWWDAQCGISDSAAHVRDRRSEDAAVLQSLGVTALHLDLLDGQYRDVPVPVEEIVRAVAERTPAVNHVYAPAGIGHPDHALVRDAGALLHDCGAPVTIYADYCYCTRKGWPTFVRPDGRPEADDQWRASIGHLVGDRLRTPRIAHLTDEESSRKLEAMRGYVTQFANVEAEEPKWQFDGKPSADPQKRAIEVFYDLAATLSPAARSGR
jgi:LmbE family N-acetylglucosaminyl deacetylase